MPNVKHVRTPEGAKYYDLPMGAPITADAVKKAEALAKGVASSVGGARRLGAPQGPGPKSNILPGNAPNGAPRVPEVPNGFPRGPKVPHVAKDAPNLPHAPGAPKARTVPSPTGNKDISYLISPNETVRVQTKNGLVDLDPALQDAVLLRITEGTPHAPSPEGGPKNVATDAPHAPSGSPDAPRGRGASNASKPDASKPDALSKPADAQPTGPDPVRGRVGSGAGLVAGREDSHGSGSGVVLASGKRLKTIGALKDSPRIEALRSAQKPKVTPPLYELDAKAGAQDFHDALVAAKSTSTFGAAVYVYDPAEYADMRLFMLDDGSGGMALHGDEIVSGFVAEDSQHKGAARSMIARMADEGGTRLDAFDTVLPEIYAKEGFVPVSRIPWDDQQAPPGWSPETFKAYNDGKPDVVFMKYDPASVDKAYVPGSGATVASYDEGVASTANKIPETKTPSAPAAPSPPAAPSSPATPPASRFVDEQGHFIRGAAVSHDGSMGETIGEPSPGDAEAMAVPGTFSAQFMTADGHFTPERMAVHAQIIRDALAGLERQQTPTQYMNGGGPASGKGSMTKGSNRELTAYPAARTYDDLSGQPEAFDGSPQAVLIDPDILKMQLPEVRAIVPRLFDGTGSTEDAAWAGRSHEESSYLAKRLHRAALERGYHVIYDGTGDSGIESVEKKVAAARELGYRVEANYLYLDPNEGITRAAQRAERTHRIVPRAAITHTYDVLPTVFEQILERPALFDSVRLFNNNVGRGQPSTLIGENTGAGWVTHDASALVDFLSSPTVVRERVRVNALADDIATRAAAHEPEVTSALVSLAAGHGASMVQLDQRLTTRQALEHDIPLAAKESKISVEEAASASTALRYTMSAASAEKYPALVQGTLEDFRSRGYSLQIHSAATPSAAHLGVEASLTSPNGEPFRLHFHTPESLAVEKANNDLHEQQRLLSPKDPKYTALATQMADNATAFTAWVSKQSPAVAAAYQAAWGWRRGVA